MPRRTKTQTRSEANGREAAPVRRLYAFVLLDGSSYELYEPLRRLKTRLGALTGRRILIRLVGDTAQSDAVFLDSLPEQRRAALLNQADRYVADIVQTGRESHHVLAETRRMMDALQLEDKDLPCIAFVPPGSRRVLATLRIDAKWCRSEERRRRLLDELVDWFESRTVFNLLEKGTKPRALRQRLSREMSALGDSVNAAIGEALIDEDALRRKAAASPRVRKEVRLIFDAGAGTAFDGVPLRLTPTPRAFLRVLAKHAGQAVGHAALVRESRGLKDALELDTEKLARGDKSAVMKALRVAAAKLGKSRKEVDGLIEREVGAYKLNLSAEKILM